MTETIDTFLIAHGVDAVDLKSAPHRTWLYGAILIEAALVVIFGGLAVMAWT